MGKRGKKPVPLEERFHRHYELGHRLGCWVWTANISPNGYGRIGVCDQGKWRTEYAHRVSYELHHGPIPTDLVVDHTCRNTRCVNPAHLRLLTREANTRSNNSPSMIRHWIFRCARGHDMTDPEVRYIRPDNGRAMCRVCQRMRNTKAWRLSRANAVG